MDPRLPTLGQAEACIGCPGGQSAQPLTATDVISALVLLGVLVAIPLIIAFIETPPHGLKMRRYHRNFWRIGAFLPLINWVPFVYIGYRAKVWKWYLIGGILGFLAFLSIPTSVVSWLAAIVYSFVVTSEYQTRLTVLELVDEETGQVIGSWQENDTSDVQFAAHPPAGTGMGNTSDNSAESHPADQADVQGVPSATGRDSRGKFGSAHGPDSSWRVLDV